MFFMCSLYLRNRTRNDLKATVPSEESEAMDSGEIRMCPAGMTMIGKQTAYKLADSHVTARFFYAHLHRIVN